MTIESEAGKILQNEDPIMSALKVIGQLQERIETGEKLPGISDQDWESIPDKVSFRFLNFLLTSLWSDSFGGGYSDIVGPQGSPVIWRGCQVTLERPKGSKTANRAVLEIPDNPVKIVYLAPSVKFFGLETATIDHIREAAQLIDPFREHVIKRGRKRKQVYLDSLARIEAGESYDDVLADVQYKDPDISSGAFRSGLYRLGYTKGGK